MIVFVRSCVADLLDGAPLAKNDTFAAESTSVVVFISGGFAHPGWRYISIVNLTDIIEYMFMLPPLVLPVSSTWAFNSYSTRIPPDCPHASL